MCPDIVSAIVVLCGPIVISVYKGDRECEASWRLADPPTSLLAAILLYVPVGNWSSGLQPGGSDPEDPC